MKCDYFFSIFRPGENILEILKEPSKRKIPAQKNTVDHILLIRLNLSPDDDNRHRSEQL